MIEIGTFTLSIGAATTARRTWRGAAAGLSTGTKYFVGFMWGGSGCYAPTRPADGVHVVDQFLVSGEVTPQPRTTRSMVLVSRAPFSTAPPPTPSQTDAISEAEAISCNGEAQGATTDGVNYLGAASPDRFYRLTLAASRNVTVHTCGGNSYDTQVWLYNQDGMEPIEHNDDHEGLCPASSGAANIDSRLATRVLQPGTYIIHVEGYMSQSGSYRLQVDCTIPVFRIYQPVNILPIRPIPPPPTRPPFRAGMAILPTPPPVAIGGGISRVNLTRPEIDAPATCTLPDGTEVQPGFTYETYNADANSCTTCECVLDGSGGANFVCPVNGNEVCPRLNCPGEEVMTEDECCPQCPDTRPTCTTLDGTEVPLGFSYDTYNADATVI